MMSLIYAMAIPTCHLGYFDGFSFFFLCPFRLSSVLSSAEKQAFWGTFAGAVSVATPCCSPDGSEALPPQQRSHQPASTAGEEMEGGARITMVIVLRQEENCANLWKNTNQYLNISDVVKQQTQ